VLSFRFRYRAKIHLADYMYIRLILTRNRLYIWAIVRSWRAIAPQGDEGIAQSGERLEISSRVRATNQQTSE